MAPKKNVKVVAPAEVLAEEVPPTTTEPASGAPAEATAVETVDRFSVVLAKLQSWQADLKELVATVKALQKEHTKLKAQKTGRKTRKNSGTNANGEKRTPSGFAKPTDLSDELCDFLGVARGSSMARTEVTRIINQYVKDNKLQNPDDRRMIVPDAKLKTIVTLGPEDKLTYFNLQSFIKRHFKTNATPVA
jgi:chromatin remodeling complex protein RSC6